jgi:hypothetical protein
VARDAGNVRTGGLAFIVFPQNYGRELCHGQLECCPEVATMMTEPAFAIKNHVQQLVDVQIDTLRKPSSLTSSELDEYGSRSERIALSTNNWI